MSYIQKLIKFLDRDIWRIPTKKLSRRHSFLITQLRVIVLAVREFRGNQCQLNASALTFYTLISIVPIMAMAFGLAKGFGLDKALATQLMGKFPGHEQTLEQIIGFANNLLNNTNGGIVAGIGVIVLFWTVIKVLNSIESSFNDIWGIKQARSFGRKVTDYLSIMFICPFFVIASGGITVFIASQVELLMQKLSFLGPLVPLVVISMNILPYVMVSILFTFIYVFMPNTKVNLVSGLIGGIIAGTTYQVVQLIYIHFQIGAANMNVIYGSFAALPLFLIWLQLSWRIVLFGAEVSFAHQNVETYEFEQDCMQVSRAFKRILSLRIVCEVVKRFEKAEAPLTGAKIIDKFDIPVRLGRDILFRLTEVGVLSELRDASNRQSSYQPGRDIQQLTVKAVLDALDKTGSDSNIAVIQDEEFIKLAETMKKFDEHVRNLPANKLLKDI